MDPEVIKFYKDNGYRFSDFFDGKRHHGMKFNRAQIKAGGVEYYDKIQSGEIKPRQIEIGWGIIEHAKNARFEDFLNDDNILREHKPIIEGLEDSIKRVERTERVLWYVFWPLLLGFIYFLLEYIGNYGGIPI